MAKEFTIVLPGLRCDQINLIANEMVASATAPTTVVGWAHALQREVVASGFPVRFDGAAIAVEEFNLLPGHPKLTPDGGKDMASIRDDKLGRILFSLILRATFDADDVEDATGEESHDRHAGMLLQRTKDAVLASRFAGSPVFVNEAFSLSRIAVDAKSLRSALWPIRRSWILVDRADLLEGLEPQEKLNRILDVTQFVEVKPEPKAEEAPATGKKPKKAKDAKPPKRRFERVFKGEEGYVVPTMVGYQAIESQKERPIGRNAPQGTRHVFAETLTSLGAFVALSKRLRESAEAPLSGALWRPESDPKNGRFYATARI